jgi:hypothetical protein
MSGEYLGDFTGTETIVVVFDTFDSNGASITAAGSPAFSTADIEIYKGSSVTQRSSDSGYTLIDTDGIDIDSNTGIHGFTIDLSDDTDAGFYATGNDFYIVVNGLTIDGQIVRFIAARFSIQNRNISANVTQISGDSTAADNLEATYDGTGYTDDAAPATQEQLGSLAIGSAAISTVAGSYTLTTGTQSSGLYTDTETLNQVYHRHTDTAGVMELYYQFDVGGAGVAVTSSFTGYLQGSNDTLTIYAYNWVGATWDVVGTLVGSNSATPITDNLNLLTRHTGTGANLGLVRIRFYAASGLTSATLSIDQIYVSYAVVSQTVGYALGAIWYNDSVANTNTEAYVDGVADNPISTMTAFNTLSASTGLDRMEISPGSTVTLAATQNNQVFSGDQWTLDLGGQDITGSKFIGAANGVIGTASGVFPFFKECSMGDASIPAAALQTCGLSGTLTLNSVGDYYFFDCFSQVAGSGTPVIDFSAAGSPSGVGVSFRRYSGGIKIMNMSDLDRMSFEFAGQVIVDSSCTGGTLTIRGPVKLIDNSSGAVDIIYTSPTADQVAQGTVQAATASTVTLAADESTVDGQYDPGRILIITGTGAGQMRNIIDYSGSTKLAVIDKDWRTTPDTTSSYIIFAAAPELHVNGGAAQAGAASSVTLNALASSTDDIYVGQTVFIVGGTGADQSRVVIAYNGTTKVATVHKAWDITPDSTSSYVMSPLPTIGDYVVNATPALIADAVWDEVLTAAAHNVASSAGRRLRQAQEYQGYEDGAIWIDTNNGSSGTDPYTNGVVELPSDNIADATTLAVALNYRHFRVITASSFTLAQTYANYLFDGTLYSVALGGQDISDTEIIGAANGVTGIATGTFPFLKECSIGAVTLPPCALDRCGLTSTLTVGAAGAFYLVDCFSQVAGTSTPALDYVVGVGPTEVSLRRYSGGIELRNMQTGDVTSLEGDGQVVIAASCSGGTLAIRGNFTITDNSGGAVTIVRHVSAEGDSVDTQLAAIVEDTGSTIPGLITALNDVSVTDILTTQMTESYAADGTAPTLAQALMLIQQSLGDFSISGTTITVKKLDGSATAATYTLDDGTSPTSRTRST